jgi:hypothetical protein
LYEVVLYVRFAASSIKTFDTTVQTSKTDWQLGLTS